MPFKNPEDRKAWEKRNRAYRQKLANERRYRLRDECYSAYGGRCACCGEDRTEFLGIDHIDGSGNLQRRALGRHGRSYQFRRWLRERGYPKDNYRLLCHNCNDSRGNFGYCPHEIERAASALLVA